MRKLMEGVVSVVQESRLLLTDDRGVSHLFILGPNAQADTVQLAPLQRAQARVRVGYTPGGTIVGNLLSTIELT